jgi:hypothetical protein
MCDTNDDFALYKHHFKRRELVCKQKPNLIPLAPLHPRNNAKSRLQVIRHSVQFWQPIALILLPQEPNKKRLLKV